MTTSIKNENGTIESTYDSSNIASSIYDTTNYTLYIIFVKGNLKYKYINVNPDDYNKLQSSESTGKAFIEFIKNKYTAEKILD
jgi:hypothetical protein